jgi:hypothetical protein
MSLDTNISEVASSTVPNFNQDFAVDSIEKLNTGLNFAMHMLGEIPNYLESTKVSFVILVILAIFVLIKNNKKAKKDRLSAQNLQDGDDTLQSKENNLEEKLSLAMDLVAKQQAEIDRLIRLNMANMKESELKTEEEVNKDQDNGNSEKSQLL